MFKSRLDSAPVLLGRSEMDAEQTLHPLCPIQFPALGNKGKSWVQVEGASKQLKLLFSGSRTGL